MDPMVSEVKATKQNCRRMLPLQWHARTLLSSARKLTLLPRCILIIAGVVLLTILPMDETYKRVILEKRAKKLGMPPPPGPKVLSMEYVKVLFTVTLFRPLYMLFAEPIVLLFGIYNGFTFSILFAYFAAYPYTFSTVYGFEIWQTGLTFIGIGVGVLLAVLTIMLCDKLIYQKKFAEALQQGLNGAAPEHRLYAAMIGAFTTPIGSVFPAFAAKILLTMQ